MPDPIQITRQALYEEPISPLIYGDFMEPLNDLLPGMWADRLQDRKFGGCTQPRRLWLEGENWTYPRWEALACGLPSTAPRPEASIELEMVHPEVTLTLDGAQPFVGQQSARVHVGGEEARPYLAGIAQQHVAVQKGERLHFKVYVRGVAAEVPLQVRLGRPYGVFFQTYAQAELGGAGGAWHKLEADLVSTVTDPDATLIIGVTQPATFWVGRASLMPADSVCGWRADIVEAIRALHPGVIRFGGSSLIYYQWEQGIGPRERRAPFLNEPWGNMEENDVGLHEFLQFCELVGAEPLICLNSNSTTIEQVLDEIEYCNGPAESRYGAIRAQMGHPAPFNVRYWQIGNEQSGEEYERTLVAYARAIRERRPDLVLLASYPSERLLTGLASAVDYICPHLYRPHSPAMEAEVRALIARVRGQAANPNLRLGITEWNHTGGHWGWARAWLLTLYNALNAGRMLNMYQRLGDTIRIANRSNMTNSSCSGILQTRGAEIYFAPTYYVQRAYATLSGDRALRLVAGDGELLDLSATQRTASGETILAVVNGGAHAQRRQIILAGQSLAQKPVHAWTLSGSAPEAVNSWADKACVAPQERVLVCPDEALTYAFPAYSVTFLRFEGAAA
jgi:alpha-L-arabinofuranosidase